MNPLSRRLFLKSAGYGSLAAISTGKLLAASAQPGPTCHVYKHIDQHNLMLEIDLPDQVGPFPVVLYAHSWSGNLNQLRKHSQYLLKRGIAGVRINYRKLSEGTRFKDAFQDIMDAIQFVRSNAIYFSFDMNRFGLAGASAGAMLSSLAAQKTPECIAYVGFNGIYDLYSSPNSDWPSDSVLNQMIRKQTPDTLKDASAIHNIKQNPPDTLLLHGTADTTVSYESAVRFAETIRSKGGRAWTKMYKGREHGFFNANKPDFADIMETVDDHFTRVFQLQCQLKPGFEIVAKDDKITVMPGTIDWNGKPINLTKAESFKIKPAEIVTVENEPLKLSTEIPKGFRDGTRLKGPAAGGINAKNCLIPESLEIRTKPGGNLLEQGKDYLQSDEFAMVGLGPHSRVSSNDTVYATYQYAQMRIDSLDISDTGKLRYSTGKPHTTIPKPPGLPSGQCRLANIFRPYNKKSVDQCDVFPILASKENIKTASTTGRIPKTLTKLKNGQPVTIVCWGDSVTHGGDASVPEKKYVNVFKTGLEKRFPAADIRVVNISVGGSNSRQWLYPQEYPFSRKNRQKQLNFNRILDEKPDLVTIEFVNDSRLSAKEQNKVYQDIFTQLDAIQAEIILITPHFTHPDWMGFSHLRESENRDYVHALNYFATKYHTGIADASTRWQNLWKQGIPYLTLLHNSVNHPDDRGHLIFAEELWKCFQ